jgi:mono/diheme cytochrome c family protein
MIAHVTALSILGLLFNSPVVLGQDEGESPGGSLYRRECATCHQMSGAPVSSIERVMRVTMRHLASPEVQAKTDAELSSDVAEGIGRMRAFPELSNEEVAALVTHMRSLVER